MRVCFRWLGRWLVVLLVTAICCSALGETQAPDKKAVLLDTVVVTAAAFQTGDVDPDTTPASVTVIQREAFEGQTESLAQVIEKQVGVQVRQSGGLGSFSTVSLRGSSSDQVMVFLDGILLNDASGGGVDLSNIALSDVQAIEIYRGTTPVNFSKASIGGVVNIRTLRATKGFRATATAGYGSFNTRKISGYINHKPGRWDYLVSADHLASANDFEMLNDNGTALNPLDDRWEKRNNAQVAQYNLLGKAGYDFSGVCRLDFLNQFFKKNQGLPSWNNHPETHAALCTARNIATLRLTADDLTSLHLNTRTQVAYTWKEEEYDDRQGQIGLGVQHNTYTTNRVGADFLAEWLTKRHAVILSAGAMTEAYATENHLKEENPRDSHRQSASLGLQDSFFLMGEKLIITPALRHTWLRDELQSSVSPSGNPLEGRTRTDQYLSPQIGVRYLPRPWLTLRSNLAQYVREPSFFELFGDRGFINSDPDLKAEKGLNFDMGAGLTWRTPSAWLQRAGLSITYFRNEVDDLITRSYDARGVGKSVNLSGALIQGLEFAATVECFDHLRAVFNVTWQDPRHQSEIKAFDAKNLPGRFQRSYFGRLEARHRKVTVYAEYIQEEEMYYDTANLLKAKDKKEVNAGVAWPWRSLTISLDGKNLGDERYEDFNGYPLPGRSFYVSLKYDF